MYNNFICQSVNKLNAYIFFEAEESLPEAFILKKSVSVLSGMIIDPIFFRNQTNLLTYIQVFYSKRVRYTKSRDVLIHLALESLGDTFLVILTDQMFLIHLVVKSLEDAYCGN